jgi:CO dehydrogenase maturation factor
MQVAGSSKRYLTVFLNWLSFFRYQRAFAQINERKIAIMPFSIALAGKGGTGKTTLAGMLIKYLIQNNKTPILAVDADCNANLNDVLGLKISDTLGNAREEMKRGDVPNGMTKNIFMEMKLEQAVIEADGFDLIVMGQPEGAGCYCAANTLLTEFLERLQNNYPYIVMDNEAGMEHISRLTTKNVDILLIISDPSHRSLQAAVRIDELARCLNIGVGKSYVVVNMAKGAPSEKALEMIKRANLELIGTVPEDDLIYEYDFEGRPTFDIPEDSKSLKAAFDIFDKIVA